MAKLALLRHEEGIRLDPDCLIALYAELGEGGAERVIVRAMEELAARLTEMQRFADDGNAPALARSASFLAKIARQIGMVTLARVAADVVLATDSADGAAQAATLARLTRIGDRSLTAVWDLRDMTV